MLANNLQLFHGIQKMQKKNIPFEKGQNELSRCRVSFSQCSQFFFLGTACSQATLKHYKDESLETSRGKLRRQPPSPTRRTLIHFINICISSLLSHSVLVVVEVVVDQAVVIRLPVNKFSAFQKETI